MKTLLFGGSERGRSNDLFFHRLETILTSAPLKQRIQLFVSQQGWTSTGLSQEIELLRAVIPELAADQQECDRAIENLRTFVREMNAKRETYLPKSRQNPASFFWPNPYIDAKQLMTNTLPMARSYDLIDSSTRIVSLGSCFASEMAQALQARGYNYVVTEAATDELNGVISADQVHKDRVPFSAAWGLIFNTPSFRQLAEKAFRIRELPRILIKFEEYMRNKDLYFDPFRENIAFSSPEAYEANYERHRQAARQALEAADLIILTFGLNECWEFIPSGAVSAMPPVTEEMASIMQCKILTVAENVANIQAFIDIVRAHNKNVRFIISVSPVPFKWTVHTDRHVIEANCHSKAVLRVAAEDLVQRNKGVYYLPSYETVTQCVQDPWEADQRHVRREAVARVMELVERMFFKSDSQLANKGETVVTLRHPG